MNMQRIVRRRGGSGAAALLLIAVLGAVTACTSTPEPEAEAQASNLTPGGVKRTIVKGETDQATCLEVFGSPDLVTHRDGMQIWTYDKTSYDYEKRSDYFTVIIAGTGGDRVRSSSRSTMLILYFDEQDIVRDYRLSAVKF